MTNQFQNHTPLPSSKQMCALEHIDKKYLPSGYFLVITDLDFWNGQKSKILAKNIKSKIILFEKELNGML